MTKPLVSIVVPAYNHELYIVECLDSILEQSYKNYELVIIDDGSSDMTSSLINSWLLKNRNEVPNCNYKTRENRGVTETLNELISLSSGDFIFVVGSDDKVTNSGIDDLVDYFMQHCDDNCVLYSGLYFINEESEYLTSDNDRLRYNLELINNSKLNLLTYLFCRWGAPFNFPFFTKNGFLKICGSYPPQYKIEDYYLALRYFIYGDVRFTVHYTREYRIQKNEAEKTKKRNYRDAMRTITSDAIQYSHGWKRMVLKLSSGLYANNFIIRVPCKIARDVLAKLVLYYSRFN